MDSVNIQSFQAKYQSKRECYNFLTVQVEIYLPAYETVTIYFLKDIISGKKKRKCRIHFFSNRAVDVKAKSVRTICIPQYEGLAMKDMDEQVFQLHPIIFDYLFVVSAVIPCLLRKIHNIMNIPLSVHTRGIYVYKCVLKHTYYMCSIYTYYC